MAGFSKASYTDKKTGKSVDAGFRVTWKYNGKALQSSVKTKKEAVRLAGWITERCNLIKQGLKELEPPQGANLPRWFMSEGKDGLSVNTGMEKANTTITSVVDAFLAARKQELQAGNLSASSYSSDVYRLGAFKRHCEKAKKSTLADIVTADFLGGYRSKLLDSIAKGKMSAFSVKHVLRAVKACLKYAYRQEIIDLMPRCLDDYAKITLPTPPLAFYTVDEIKALLNAASPRTRLYMLLGVNLGYTQSDIASLEHSHIDWNTNTITRNRHKTGHPQLAKLWPLTAKLLKAEMSNANKTPLALLGENGNPLVYEIDGASGKPIKIDGIANAFRRLKAKAEMSEDKRGFKHFRKTSANNIAIENQDAPHLVDLFLGHTQKNMAKFYAKRHYDLLFEATDKLATLYALSND